ncbi:hypothetical protein SADO_14168 [Salinisphaera dokdonensis CL-ES53]|uniref:Uncharacterized protein n=1 Tax=Salinisphaera dokdonensis CL-ES53 TaxID=1304272 RepID=A0ABV2B452_9GAMM
MGKSVLYLLKCLDIDAFTIGTSSNVAQPVRTLPQKIDLDRSLQIPLEGEGARKVKSFSQHLFRRHRYTMPRGDGYTEWFDTEAWDPLLDFIASQAARLGAGKPEAISLPAPDAPTQETEAQRLAKRREVKRIQSVSIRSTNECAVLIAQCLETLFERDVRYAIDFFEGARDRSSRIYLLGRVREIKRCWSFYMTASHAQVIVLQRSEMQGHLVGRGATLNIGTRRGAMILDLQHVSRGMPEWVQDIQWPIETLLVSRRATTARAARVADRLKRAIESYCWTCPGSLDTPGL